MILDLIGTVADLAYIVLLGFGFYYARPSAPLRHLDIAFRLYLLAALVQGISLGADLMDVDEDGWVPVGISVFTLAVCLALGPITARRAARMDGAR